MYWDGHHSRALRHIGPNADISQLIRLADILDRHVDDVSQELASRMPLIRFLVSAYGTRYSKQHTNKEERSTTNRHGSGSGTQNESWWSLYYLSECPTIGGYPSGRCNLDCIFNFFYPRDFLGQEEPSGDWGRSHALDLVRHGT